MIRRIIIGLTLIAAGSVIDAAGYQGPFDINKIRELVSAPASPQLTARTPPLDNPRMTFGDYPIHFLHPTDLKQMVSELFPNVKIAVDVRHRRLMFWAPPADVAHLWATIQSLDVLPAQIEIEVKIIETSNEFSESLKQWLVDMGSPLRWTIDVAHVSVIPSQVLSGFLDNLKNSGKASLVAQPSITANDNQTAVVQVGERVPYLTTIVNDRSTSTQVNTVETGVGLEVTPQIATGDLVQVEFKVSLDNIKRYRELAGSQYPIITHRLAQSRVTIPTGQTLVIAGLTDSEQKSLKSGVPGVESVPLIGDLFSGQSTEIISNNVIVTITPKVIRSPPTDHPEQ